MSDILRVTVADDHPIIRQAVCQILHTSNKIKVVAEADNGRQALEQVKEHKPDIAILDIQMPDIDGFEAAKVIQTEYPETQIIFLTMFKEPALIRKVFDLGIKGYILKESAVLDILKGVEAVANDNLFLSPQVSQVLLNRTNESSREKALTTAEKNILRLISQGKSSREISIEMSIAGKTVENHRSNICKKLGITGNSALLKYALKHFADS